MKWYESQRVRLAVSTVAFLCVVTLAVAAIIGFAIGGERGMFYGMVIWGMLWAATAFGLL
jgi:hypothetical protein